MESHEIILYPLMGEKATLLREKENKLTFIVNAKSTKEDVKKAVEELFEVEVVKTNIMWVTDGKKKAHVKLSPDYDAEEIASHFGVL